MTSRCQVYIKFQLDVACKIFFFVFRVDKSTSLFHNVPSCNSTTCDGSVFDMDFCTCKKKSGGMDISCGQNVAQTQNAAQNPPFHNAPNVKQNTNQGKREATYSDDVIYLYDNFEPEFSTLPPRKRRTVNFKMSLENATEYCRKTILNTKAAQVCLELSSVNVSSAIKQCAADLQVNFS